MNTDKLIYLLVFTAFYSCNRNSQTEKYQGKRDNIIDVRHDIKEIPIEDVLIGQNSRIYIIEELMVIKDAKTTEEQIHLFDKKSFEYKTSTAPIGQGPGEITVIGHIEPDRDERIMYVSDHGKQAIFSYHLDSVLAGNPRYMPETKLRIREKEFPGRYTRINDTLCVGLTIEPIGVSDFKQSLDIWDMNTGQMKPLGYEHSDIEKKRFSFAVSEKDNLYVMCYSSFDLITIGSLEGKLKYNIYGPKWDKNQKNTMGYFGKVIFCQNKIWVLYSGKEKRSRDRLPSRFMLFDLSGNYIQSFETGYNISDYCYDEENNRILMILDDEMQFACFNIAKLPLK